MHSLKMTTTCLLTLGLSISGCNSQNTNTDNSTGIENKTSSIPDQWVNNPVDYVNPFIGTEGVYNHRQAANVVPGAVVPHGMFNFGPEHAYTKDLLKESERMTKQVLDE